MLIITDDSQKKISEMMALGFDVAILSSTNKTKRGEWCVSFGRYGHAYDVEDCGVSKDLNVAIIVAAQKASQ